jgi:hypothetical protein
MDHAKEKLSRNAFNLFKGLYNLSKAGVKWSDMHFENIMFRGNDAVIIDLGYSDSPEKSSTIQAFENTVSGATTTAPNVAQTDFRWSGTWFEPAYFPPDEAVDTIRVQEDFLDLEFPDGTAVSESFSSGAIAGTDTRLGGVTFEPNSFEEQKPKNNAIRNEKVFYRNDNDPVLLPGWVYVADLDDVRSMVKLGDLRFDDEEVEDPELEDWDSKETGIGMKKRTGIDWDLDDGSYRAHLVRLRKAHNI